MRAIHKEIANQDIMFEVYVNAECRQGASSFGVESSRDHEYINVRFSVKIAAHFGSVQNHALNFITKLRV